MDTKKKAFIINLLRRGTFRWRPRRSAHDKGRIQIKIGNRPIWHYTCALCPPEKLYRDSEIVMDHIKPVVDPTTGFTTWDEYIDRMFCEEDGFQRLCEAHHDAKCQEENATRKETRKKKTKRPKKLKH